MKQMISVYFPYFPTDRLRRQRKAVTPLPALPLALSGREGQKLIVTAADRAARRLGITPGMAVTQARAMAANLHIEPSAPDADTAALEEIALWALRRYSPTIATDKDGLWIDATGCPHLFGGEELMLKSLTGKLKENGIEAKAAMAPTYGAAHGFARKMRGETIVVPEDRFLAMLLPLPVATLRLPADTVQGLSKLGIETIGELKEKPRKSLAMRFGKETGRRFDQAAGYAAEVIDPIVPAELITERRIFAEPVAAPETIARYIAILAEALCKKLEATAAGARCLDLFCHRVDNEVKVLRIGLAQPRRDARRLARLLCDKLETLDPGYGIELMRLSATWVEPLSLRQIPMEQNIRPQADFAGLIDSLSNRIGPEHVYQLVPVESDVPERSLARVAPLTMKNSETILQWPRPVRLFGRPEPIETIAMLPDYPPISFTWRGKRYKVRAADGPERIYGEWWRRDAEMEAVRDYFQLENETGERFWVFRAGDGILPGSGSQKWFMHGLFA